MSYTNVHVKISENQQQKLKHTVDTKSPVSIRLNYKDLCGSDVLALTNSQVNRMTKAYENGKGVPIKMSKRQVVHNMKTEGGFLSFFSWFSRKGPAIFGKDRSPNIVDWGTVRCRASFGAKSNKQGHGKRTVFEKSLKHCKS